MTNKQMDSLAVLALLAALQNQKSHARLNLARLNEHQLAELLNALQILREIVHELLRAEPTSHA